MSFYARIVALLLSVIGAGCATSRGSFVWVDQLQSVDETEQNYRIRPGDVLSVRVWNQEGMSARARVRDDGRISLPFLNDVMAAGFTPNVLSEQLQQRLKDFIVTPVVTIALEEPKPFSVSVMGEVLRPGVYTVEPNSGVLFALASAGGLSQFASEDQIYVLRKSPRQQRIRFKYEALVQATGKASAFRLKSGDAIVVE